MNGQGNASMEMACGLAEEVVRTFGEVRLRVFGTSMAPAVLPGDLVTVQRAALEEISAGEIVLFLQNERLFVHRVVGRKVVDSPPRANQPHLITRGDRLKHADPPVTPQELLGRVVWIVRDDRRIELNRRDPNTLLARLLRASDVVTYFYVRLSASLRSLFFRGVKCRV
jgi:signal peptidase I